MRNPLPDFAGKTLWTNGFGRNDPRQNSSKPATGHPYPRPGHPHTRLVPGLVDDTKVVPGTRIVTIVNGAVVREPIVAIDEARRRLVWSVEGGLSTHYNGAVQVFNGGDGARIVWIADFLPDDLSSAIDTAMTAGEAAMKRALNAVVE